MRRWVIRPGDVYRHLRNHPGYSECSGQQIRKAIREYPLPTRYIHRLGRGRKLGDVFLDDLHSPLLSELDKYINWTDANRAEYAAEHREVIRFDEDDADRIGDYLPYKCYSCDHRSGPTAEHNYNSLMRENCACGAAPYDKRRPVTSEGYTPEIEFIGCKEIVGWSFKSRHGKAFHHLYPASPLGERCIYCRRGGASQRLFSFKQGRRVVHAGGMLCRECEQKLEILMDDLEECSSLIKAIVTITTQPKEHQDGRIDKGHKRPTAKAASGLPRLRARPDHQRSGAR